MAARMNFRSLEHSAITRTMETGYPEHFRPSCSRCGNPATDMDDTGYYCRECAVSLARDRLESMSENDALEWAGFLEVE